MMKMLMVSHSVIADLGWIAKRPLAPSDFITALMNMMTITLVDASKKNT